MRVRLTRNVDKERGFVNGALAEVEHVLAKDVFVAKTPTGVRLLVHPVAYKDAGRASFMPFCYGYAMTMRRAQGSTLELVGLQFDHSYPADRGYAYVGSSRVRKAEHLYLMGKARRTDWLPVGGGDAEEQLTRGADSADTSSNSDFGSEDRGSSASSDDEDRGASSMLGSDDMEEDRGASSEEVDDQADSEWERDGAGSDAEDE